MPADDETIRQLHRREREALIAAARTRTAMFAMGAGVAGLIIGIYVGRDVTMKFLRDMMNDR